MKKLSNYSFSTPVALSAALFSILTFAAPSAKADTLSINVPNFSFEIPASTSDTVANFDPGNPGTTIQDWTFNTANGGRLGTINYANTTSGVVEGTGAGSQGVTIGSYYGYYTTSLTSGNLTNNDGSAAGASGLLTTLLPNTTYTLTAAVGIPASAALPAGYNGYDGHFDMMLIDSLGNVLASSQIDYGALTTTLQDESISFTTAGVVVPNGLSIELQLTNSPMNNVAVIDNVRLSESGPNIVAPEPSTYAMLIGGFALLGLALRHRRTLGFNA